MKNKSVTITVEAGNIQQREFGSEIAPAKSIIRAAIDSVKVRFEGRVVSLQTLAKAIADEVNDSEGVQVSIEGVEDLEPVGLRFKIPMYHGTSMSIAKRILSEGFMVQDLPRTTFRTPASVYMTSDKELAKEFARYKAEHETRFEGVKDDEPVLIEIWGLPKGTPLERDVVHKDAYRVPESLSPKFIGKIIKVR